MSTSAVAPEVPWTTILARGLDKKVISPSFGQGPQTQDLKLVGELMFQHEDFRQQELARRANAIVEQALTPGSVLFSFPAGTFANRIEAYKTIQANVGAAGGFRTLNLYQRKSVGGLLIEVKFVSPADASKAVVTGFPFNGKVFRGALSEDKSVREGMVHVKLNLLRIPDKATFLVDLKKSLRFYGEVYQVKRYTCGGFFEGQVSVVLDTMAGYKNVEGEQVACQPLERMLYLSVWDTFVPATFKGAKRVCNFCRKAGHVVKECPELAKLVCYNCGKAGHTAGRCKVVKSDGDLLDEYVQLTNKVASKVHVSDNISSSAQEFESEINVVSVDTGIDGVAIEGTPMVVVESISESDSMQEVNSVVVEDSEDLPEAANDIEINEELNDAYLRDGPEDDDGEIILVRPGTKKVKAFKTSLEKKNISSNSKSRTVMKKTPLANSKSVARRAQC